MVIVNLLWMGLVVIVKDKHLELLGMSYLLRMFLEVSMLLLKGYYHWISSEAWYQMNQNRVLMFSVLMISFQTTRHHSNMQPKQSNHLFFLFIYYLNIKPFAVSTIELNYLFAILRQVLK